MKWYNSISIKIATLVLGGVVGVVVLLLVFNTFFLENYYLKRKSDRMKDAYKSVRESLIRYDKGEITREKCASNISSLCEDINATAIVQRSDWGIAMTTEGNVDVLKRRMLDILFKSEENSDDILEKTDEYTLQLAYDARNSNNYLEIYGYVGDGDTILMRVSIQSIRDNIGIFNEFIIRIGIIVCIIDVLISLFLAARIARPVKKLSKIAVKMGDMDFTKRYDGKSKDEIDVLGRNLNQLADKLDHTICDLKNANNELTNELDRAKRLEESRIDFVGAVSHDLKTPIALIEGYAEGIRDNADDREKTLEYSEVIIDEATKMTHMVKQLLSLNRLEAGNLAIDIERFDISQMIAGILDAKKLLTAPKNITIINNVSEECMVYADPLMIEEVFTNYFTNAVNHCSENGVITIGASNHGKDVRISVKNTGEPIPEASLQKIWDKFYKVDKARTRSYGGNGIGLSIVRAVMLAHNKAYGVENLADGVEFYFDLDANV